MRSLSLSRYAILWVSQGIERKRQDESLCHVADDLYVISFHVGIEGLLWVFQCNRVRTAKWLQEASTLLVTWQYHSS